MRENVPDWIDDPIDDNLIINHKFLVSLNILKYYKYINSGFGRVGEVFLGG